LPVNNHSLRVNSLQGLSQISIVNKERSMAEQATIKRVRATVARGRTLSAPHATKRQTIGYSDDGKPIQRPVMMDYLPGQEVELTEDEVLELRVSGFLIDPDQKPVPLAEGPHFTERGPAAPAAA
jgi:hypothetical protein